MYTGWFTEITITTKGSIVSSSIFSEPPCVFNFFLQFFFFRVVSEKSTSLHISMNILLPDVAVSEASGGKTFIS